MELNSLCQVILLAAVSLTGLPQGIYYIDIQTREERIRRKVVKLK
jgi:hypothetical protein